MELFPLAPHQNILSAYPGEASYVPNFFSEKESQHYFTALENEIKWEQTTIKMYGKEVMQPRLTAWYGDEEAHYTYSGKINLPLPWLPVLQTLREKVEQHCNTSFNSVLLNLYRNGEDSMGWHRDNEVELGPMPIIASLSFGAQRDFIIRPYKKLSPRIVLPLQSGSLLIMKGEMQTYWEHALPKRRNCRSPRINLTFRKTN